MLKRCSRLLQAKKQTASSFMAAAGKTGNEEKYAQVAMEYIYEKNHVNDGRKRLRDVQGERALQLAYDRFSAVGDKAFDERMQRLVDRMNEAVEAIPDALRDEALLLNSQQPPLNYRLPTLTPPIHSYEPGFGLDVPQLRAQQMEYPPLVRPTDPMQFGGEASDSFPFVDAESIRTLTLDSKAKFEREHGEIRQAAPVTGVEGEAWEAYAALNKKALARQELILQLCGDPEFKERYDSDEEYRQQVWSERGMLPLEIEDDSPPPHQVHYAQEPAYQPFRTM